MFHLYQSIKSSGLKVCKYIFYIFLQLCKSTKPQLFPIFEWNQWLSHLIFPSNLILDLFGNIQRGIIVVLWNRCFLFFESRLFNPKIQRSIGRSKSRFLSKVKLPLIVAQWYVVILKNLHEMSFENEHKAHSCIALHVMWCLTDLIVPQSVLAFLDHSISVSPSIKKFEIPILA